jgi:hypothetical protein
MALIKFYPITMHILYFIVIMFLFWSPTESIGCIGSAAKRQKREEKAAREAAREAATHKMHKQCIETCASTSGSDANNCEPPPISARAKKIVMGDVSSPGSSIMLCGVFSFSLFLIFCLI